MLSDDRIAEMMRDTWGCASIAPRHAEAFARSIEAEVRKDDEALIRKPVEALETCGDADGYNGPSQHYETVAVEEAVAAGRARLEGPK